MSIQVNFIGDSRYDLVQEWRYCLQGGLNTIFSFYHIEKVMNTPSRMGFFELVKERIPIMTQSSDCILAARLNEDLDFKGTTEYCSGHHALIYEGKKYKTAETIKVDVCADGIPVKNGETGLAKEITIEVTTVIYDPFVLKASLIKDIAKPKYQTIIEEKILYTVVNGNIICDVTRYYKDPVNIEAYGGFASMALNLNYAYFPCGANKKDTDSDLFGRLDSNIGFNHECDKINYPDFNHFIRRDTDCKVFESVYLYDDYSGNHSEIPDDYSMYWVYNAVGAINKKIYHRIAYHQNYSTGDIQRFKCMYSWFVPISNTSDYICFQTGNMIFLDIKKAFDGLLYVTDDLNCENYDIRKRTDSIKLLNFESNGYVRVTSTGNGMIILDKKP